MSAQQWRLVLGVLFFLAHAATASSQASNCPEPDMPAETQKLMQVASERKTQHPGTGKVPVLQDPGAGEKHPQAHPKADDSLLVFSLGFLGATAFPLDFSELPQLPLERIGPEEGGGAVFSFVLLVLVLVCSLAMLACIGGDVDMEEEMSSVRKPRQKPLQHPGASVLSSATTADANSQQVSTSLNTSWQDSAVNVSRAPVPSEQVQAPQASTSRVISTRSTEAAAQRPWASSYLPEVPPEPAKPASEVVAESASDLPEESNAHLPPMLSAFPPFWGGGPSPVAEDLTQEASRSSSLPPAESGVLEAVPPVAPLDFANVPGEASSQTIFGEGLFFEPSLEATGMLCPGLMVDPSSECAMAVPIADQDMPALSMTILALDQRPVLKAEVYRGEECQAPDYFSPMIGELWPPENVSLISTHRGNQRPSVVLTSLPPDMQRLDDLDIDSEDIQILSACYLVRSDEQSLELDVYNGSGEFFGRMGRDPGRPCRFMMRGGNFGEVRYFIDGVFEDYAVLFTDYGYDTVADGEAFEMSDLPFPEAAGCMRLRIHGTQAVDAGLILTMLFCAYELRRLGA